MERLTFFKINDDDDDNDEACWSSVKFLCVESQIFKLNGHVI